MSLPTKAVFSLLKEDWIVGWHNIENEPHIGQSFGYTSKQTSIGTTNGAGPHNIQMFMLSPDLVVLHALPGFWHPDDLARELGLGKQMLALWQDEELTKAEKKHRFKSLQMAALKSHPRVTFERSGWQDFDMMVEHAKYQSGMMRDTFLCDADGFVKTNGLGKPVMKPTNQLVHERMAKRPFVKYSKFDTHAFADYGTPFYDNNLRVDGKGKNFQRTNRMPAVQMTPEQLKQLQQRAQQQAKKLLRAGQQTGKPLRIVR